VDLAEIHNINLNTFYMLYSYAEIQGKCVLVDACLLLNRLIVGLSDKFVSSTSIEMSVNVN
jgi:hypothetical protein